MSFLKNWAKNFKAVAIAPTIMIGGIAIGYLGGNAMIWLTRYSDRADIPFWPLVVLVILGIAVLASFVFTVVDGRNK